MRSIVTQTVEFVELSRQHQYQPEGMLGAGDVARRRQREHFDVLFDAGGDRRCA